MSGEKYNCTAEDCDFQTIYRRALLHHMSTRHTDLQKHLCPYCGLRLVLCCTIVSCRRFSNKGASPNKGDPVFGGVPWLKIPCFWPYLSQKWSDFYSVKSGSWKCPLSSYSLAHAPCTFIREPTVFHGRGRGFNLTHLAQPAGWEMLLLHCTMSALHSLLQKHCCHYQTPFAFQGLQRVYRPSVQTQQVCTDRPSTDPIQNQTWSKPQVDKVKVAI